MKKSLSKLFFSCLLMISTLIVTSCIQTYNSSSGDVGTFGVAPTGTDAFITVHSILVSKCTVCHGDMGGDAQSLVDGGYVIANDPLDSSLYTHLIGSDGSGTKDMPLGGPALSNTDLNAIKTWITGM